MVLNHIDSWISFSVLISNACVLLTLPHCYSYIYSQTQPFTSWLYVYHMLWYGNPAQVWLKSAWTVCVLYMKQYSHTLCVYGETCNHLSIHIGVPIILLILHDILLPVISSTIPFHYTDSDGEGWTILLDKADQRESLPNGFSWSLLLSFTGNKRNLFSTRECWSLVSFLMSEFIFWAKLFVGSHCVIAIDERREMTF